MTSYATLFSGVTDKAPLSPAYLSGKFNEVWNSSAYFGATLNAAYYAGATKEAQITAAIAAAVTSGASYVYVPLSMQPYNAAAVTFNTGVEMRAEGAPLGRPDVRGYGADPNGVLDSTAAMVAAHATGKVIDYPEGLFSFSVVTNIPSGGIMGRGVTRTILQSTDTGSSDLLTYTGTFVNIANSKTVPLFRDFLLQTFSQVKSAGAGIRVAPTSGEEQYMHFANVTINNLPISLQVDAAELYKVTDCNFLSFTSAGIIVANINNADSGDAGVVNCIFNSPFTTGAGILQKSSGGLRVVGCKFLGGKYSYLMSYNAPSNTGNLVFTGNSLELAASAGMWFSRSSGTGTFSNIVIADNQFGLSPIGISGDTTSASTMNFLSQVCITGNVFNGGALPADGVAFTGVHSITVASNMFQGNVAGDSGVSLSACTDGRIGPNFYNNTSGGQVVFTNCGNIDNLDGGAGAARTAIFSDWCVEHAGSAIMEHDSTDAPADAKYWRFYSTNGSQFIMDCLNDARSGANPIMTFNRSGYVVTNIVASAPVWAGSGISVGTSSNTGSLIPAISSLSSLVGAFVVQGSASSFTIIQWPAAQPGDQVLVTVQNSAAVSSLSSGLILHSHCTTAGKVEFRVSNVSTLVQNQSSRTYYFTRISPF